MIKLNKEISAIFRELEKNGHDVYAYGKCVRDNIKGEKTLDWDLATSARLDKLTEIFPEAEVIDEKREIIRMVFENESDESMVIADLSPYGSPIGDEEIKFYDDIETQLKDEYFILNAMADNPSRKFYDPLDARASMKEELIKTVKEPKAMFEKNPVKMFEAVELAAEMGYDMDNEVYEAIIACADLIGEDSLGYIRRSLERIVVSDHAGLGLNMLADTALLAAVVGKDIFESMNGTERNDYVGLCEGIDKVKKVKDRRLGLLYICFKPKRAHEAIDRLDFSEKTNARLHEAMDQIIKINFMGSYTEFKHYLGEVGWERYNYLNNLSKAQRIVYDHQPQKINARIYYESELKKTGDPVFPEDLAIDTNDVIEAGYAKDEEGAYALLKLVADVIHMKPFKNERAYLLKEAKHMSRSKFSRATRRVHWMR